MCIHIIFRRHAPLQLIHADMTMELLQSHDDVIVEENGSDLDSPTPSAVVDTVKPPSTFPFNSDVVLADSSSTSSPPLVTRLGCRLTSANRILRTVTNLQLPSQKEATATNVPSSAPIAPNALVFGRGSRLLSYYQVRK